MTGEFVASVSLPSERLGCRQCDVQEKERTWPINQSRLLRSMLSRVSLGFDVGMRDAGCQI
eukprot:scaffold5391_cov34-Attheya_sp.AAC.1